MSKRPSLSSDWVHLRGNPITVPFNEVICIGLPAINSFSFRVNRLLIALRYQQFESSGISCKIRDFSSFSFLSEFSIVSVTIWYSPYGNL